MSTGRTPENKLPDLDTFADLVCAHLDGRASADDHAVIDHAIAASAPHRAVYRELAQLDAALAWDNTPVKLTTPQKPDDERQRVVGISDAAGSPTLSAAGVPMYRKGYEPQPFKLRPHHYALIAATLLAACGLAAYLLTTSVDPEPSPPEPSSPPPVATLIQNTGNLRTPHGYPAEGDDYSAGEYTLSSGTAEFMLTNSVNVKLRGETRMVMRNDMNVALTLGSAAFVVPKDATGFTVHLPDRSKIVDLGTAFRVEVDDAGTTYLRVTEGKVEWSPAPGSSDDSNAEPVLIEVGLTARLIDGRPVIVAITQPDAENTIFYDSFESPRVAGGSQIDPPGWKMDPLSGGINDENMGVFDTPFGEQVAWLNQLTMTTTPQMFDHKLAVDTSYTLTLNVGRRDDIGTEFNSDHTNAYTVELIAYGKDFRDAKVLAAASSRATKSDFSETVRIELTTDESHDELIGWHLAIRLGGTIQAQFDNVRLTAHKTKPQPQKAKPQIAD